MARLPHFTTRRSLHLLTLIIAVGVTSQIVHAQTEAVLYSFKIGPTDGQFPDTGVVRDARGNLYGTTYYGGPSNDGIIFKISKRSRTVLHSFTGQTDGGHPNGLVLDNQGNLYGTAQIEGAHTCGIAFKLDRTRKFRVLYAFQGGQDGCVPVGLMRDSQGNLYGTTELGGPANVGTVFKIDATGKETVLYAFTGGAVGAADGASPLAGVIRDAAGNLYGTTYGGGPDNFGTVYKVDTANKETILHAFTSGSLDGDSPYGVLAEDSAGNLYGTTDGGGTASSGTIFKVDNAGAESILFSFTQQSQGGSPQSSLVLDSAGNLYGNTQLSGTYDWGVVFKFNLATNTETVLHYFGNGKDGRAPLGILTLDSSGRIYGTTQQGGAEDYGTVYEIVP
jgi:uncharacterized repeat protein (TIGR03803 family)